MRLNRFIDQYITIVKITSLYKVSELNQINKIHNWQYLIA
jgi:hypothetical protein